MARRNQPPRRRAAPRGGPPDRAARLLADAEAAWRSGDAAAALASLERALAAQPDHVSALAMRGGVLAARARFSAAEIDFRRAAGLAPDDDAIRFGLAQALQAQKKLAEARATYRTLLARTPDHLAALHELATVTADLGEFEAALALYDAVLRRDPRSVPGLVNRALLRVAHGTAGSPIDVGDLELAVRIAPAVWPIRCHAALAHRLAGDARAAELHYLAAARVSAEAAAARATHDYVLRQPPGVILFGERLRVLEHALRTARVDGFVAEFGVYRGTSLNFIAARHDGPVHGFDSFAGLPEAWTTTDGVGKYSTAGEPPTVLPNVRLHAGWFEDTLADPLPALVGPARLLHIDCDLYASTAMVLDRLAPRIVPGTVLVLDEYFGYPSWEEHEYRAFHELVAARSLRYRYLALNPFGKQAALVIA